MMLARHDRPSRGSIPESVAISKVFEGLAGSVCGAWGVRTEGLSNGYEKSKLMAPLWHHGTITPRSLKKKNKWKNNPKIHFSCEGVLRA